MVNETHLERLRNQPFLMAIDDIFIDDERGTVVSGRVEKGVVKIGDAVEVVGHGPTADARISRLEMYGKSVARAEPQNSVDVLFHDLVDGDASGGQVLAAPGSVRWYVVHAYSGHENRVKQNLEQAIENMDLENEILEVFVPNESEVEIQGGQRKEITQRVFPGYIFVHMRMVDEDDQGWHIVRNTPGVTGFVSAEDDRESRPRPVPLDKREEENILGFKDTDQPRVRVGFTQGQAVRITDGPFVDFMGVVDEVHADRTKLKVLVSFFGRETPVELDFLQVERA